MATLIHIDPEDTASDDFERIKQAWGIERNTEAFRRMVSVIAGTLKGPS